MLQWLTLRGQLQTKQTAALLTGLQSDLHVHVLLMKHVRIKQQQRQQQQQQQQQQQPTSSLSS
jgi:hypothetical protein